MRWEIVGEYSVHGVTSDGNGGVSWQQSLGNYSILFCKLSNGVPTLAQLQQILSEGESNLLLQGKYRNQNGDEFSLSPMQVNITTKSYADVGFCIGIFAARVEENRELVIYGLNINGDLMRNFAILSISVSVNVQEEEGRVGKLLHRETLYWYQIKVSARRDAYRDGDICYMVGDVCYPIPAKAVGNPFYVLKNGDSDSLKISRASNRTVNLNVTPLQFLDD